jgi:hypothetical protein
MIPNKTEVLNLKTRKTQVPMGYLSKKKKCKTNLRGISTCNKLTII